MKGICLLTWIPLRRSPESTSEMVSSLLFGETYQVTDSLGDWHRVRTDFDQYEGWISNAQFDPCGSDHELYNTVQDHAFITAHGPGTSILIPCGAVIPQERKFSIGSITYSCPPDLKNHKHLPVKLKILAIAQNFTNTPYLWGGRCFAGIDCSGLVQVAYKASGYSLQRDTAKQITEGKDIAFEQLDIADLVFFSKDKQHKVSHVGLYAGKGQILHASGRVRIDTLDKEGILLPDGSYSHYFLSCRRIL